MNRAAHLTILSFALLILSACSSRDSGQNNIFLNKPTEVKFGYVEENPLFGKREIRSILVVECKIGNHGNLQINIMNKGESAFSCDGSDLFQVDKDGATISAISTDLQSFSSSASTHDIWAEVGSSQTSYLNLRPNVAKVEYRREDSGKLTTLFTIVLKDGTK